MTLATASETLFRASLQKLDVPTDILHPFRKQAGELLGERGLPSKEDETFRYVPLRALYATSFSSVLPEEVSYDVLEPYVLPECRSSCLVFLNGSLNLSLSRLEGADKRIAFIPMADAMRTYGQFIRTRLTKSLEGESDPFALLNLAYHPAAALLYLPPKTILGPLQVLFFSTQGGCATWPRLHLFAGAHAKADIVLSNYECGQTLNFPFIDVALEEGAHVRLHHTAAANEHAWQLYSTRATLKRTAQFSSLQWSCGAGYVRGDTRVRLQGEGCSADLKGMWMLHGKAQAHAHVQVDHEAPHCQSMQLFKGVLSDLSQSSFEGKIYVQPIAQKTQAYQLNKNLLLSPHVIANAKPNLEIFADDVKASHGATVAQLDDELLFYLRSRGISPSVAKSLLIEGFCREVLDQFSLSSLREKAAHAIHNYLG